MYGSSTLCDYEINIVNYLNKEKKTEIDQLNLWPYS